MYGAAHDTLVRFVKFFIDAARLKKALLYLVKKQENVKAGHRIVESREAKMCSLFCST